MDSSYLAASSAADAGSAGAALPSRSSGLTYRAVPVDGLKIVYRGLIRTFPARQAGLFGGRRAPNIARQASSR